MKIVCFHLYNDYSGSPKVLHNVLEGLLQKGYEVELITSRGGILDILSSPKLRVINYNYKFSENPVVTMVRYSVIQIMTFFKAFRYALSKDTVFYINTILPVGPAIAGRLIGKEVVYHYHENAYEKSGFYKFLANNMQRLAHKIICVSKYQASFLKRQHDTVVIPNALDNDFLSRLTPDAEEAFNRRNILMLSSLKAYKGTKEFISLACKLPQFNFTLVINDTEDAISSWLDENKIVKPANLSIYPRTSETYKFYNAASLVLNLSNPDLFVETFGLTALEAMSCALPVIVPPIGGIAEMVTDDENGYKIDCRDTERLTQTISGIFNDKSLYNRLSKNALIYSRLFNQENMVDSLISFIKK